MQGQRRYDTEVLGKLGFIGVAQSAGFKLAEIKELIDGVDSADGMGDQMRSLSSRKLDEVEALLERTKAMKGWLDVAQGVRLRDPGRVRALPRRPARSRRTLRWPSGWSRWTARTVAARPPSEVLLTARPARASAGQPSRYRFSVNAASSGERYLTVSSRPLREGLENR